MLNIKKLKVGLGSGLLVGLALVGLVGFLVLVSSPTVASADTIFGEKTTTGHQCGSGANIVYTSIEICSAPHIANPILDLSFAIIKFLTDGVGLVVVASLIYAGIQYSSSAGDPQKTSQAIGRIRQSIIALMIFIFGYALLNYIIPNGFIK